ncbi:MAG: aromatic amino acid lyase, partial [Tabrizicola sp.]
MTPEILIPGQVSLAQLERIYRQRLPARLHDSVRPGIARAASHIAAAASGQEAIYGVNTGFGKLASIKIAPEDTATLQKNLILSHCCGVGAPMAEDVARLMMVLKLLSLGRGASGVRPEIVALIEGMLA